MVPNIKKKKNDIVFIKTPIDWHYSQIILKLSTNTKWNIYGNKKKFISVHSVVVWAIIIAVKISKTIKIKYDQ